MHIQGSLVYQNLKLQAISLPVAFGNLWAVNLNLHFNFSGTHKYEN